MNLERLEWFVARGAGFTAFGLLTAAVVTGLALSLRLTSPRWPAIVTKEVHRTLTTLSLWMLGLHLTMLVVDSQSGISAVGAVLPFRAEYRPWATSLGIVAMYTILAVIVSTRLRAWIGHRRWRSLHYLAFLAYGAALLHGLLAGTDTGATWASLVYIASAALVGSLVVARIVGPRRQPADGNGAPHRGPMPSRPSTTGGLPPLRQRV